MPHHHHHVVLERYFHRRKIFENEQNNEKNNECITCFPEILFVYFIWSQFLSKFEERKMSLLWKKVLFLLIMLPDFYHHATLAEQTHSFSTKLFKNKFIYCVFYVKITATKNLQASLGPLQK